MTKVNEKIKTLQGRAPVLAISALLSSIGYFAIYRLGDVRPQMYDFLWIYALLFIVYAAASYHIHSCAEEQGQWKDLLLILGFALLFRIILLFDFPFLTDDIYRYLWDGRVWSEGINPYLYPPASQELSPMRDTFIHPNINHPDIPTIYAPVLQFLFRAIYTLCPNFFGVKLAVSLFDFGTILVLLLLLRQLNLDRRLLLVYAWNPLVIIETAASGHVDSVGVFFIVLFFLFFLRLSAIPAAVALAAAVLTKFVAIIMLPFVILRFGWRRTIAFTIAFVLTILAAYWPFLDAGAALFAALNVYTTKWLFNASLFQLVSEAVAFFHPSDHLDANLMIAKKIMAVLLAGLFGGLFWRRMRSRYQHQSHGIIHEWFVLFGAICMASPTLHPWYLIWLVPTLVFYRNRAWILLTGLIFLSYVVLVKYYQSAVWQESLITVLVIYLPFYTLLIYDFLRKRSGIK